MNPVTPRMHFNFLRFKSECTFLLKLLILLSLLKCIFFFYNLHSGQGWQVTGFSNIIILLCWSVFYDIFIISVLAIPLTILFFLFKNKRTIIKIGSFIFSALFSFMVLLNIIDIFYFPFKLQLTDAELLYLLRNPFH